MAVYESKYKLEEVELQFNEGKSEEDLQEYSDKLDKLEYNINLKVCL